MPLCELNVLWFGTRFVRRLLYFYKPSSKLFAGLELDHGKARHLTVVGCQFIEFLLESDEVRLSHAYLLVHKLPLTCTAGKLSESPVVDQ